MGGVIAERHQGPNHDLIIHRHLRTWEQLCQVRQNSNCPLVEVARAAIPQVFS